MSGPFIFIATNRLKPGKLDDERARVPGLVDFIEANEPRLIAFNEYVDEEGTESQSSRSTGTPIRWHFTWRSLPSAPQPHTPRLSKRRRASRCSVRRATLSSKC